MIDHGGKEPIFAPQSSDSHESLSFLRNERGEPLTWGATPFEPTGEVIEQQRLVEVSLAKLFRRSNRFNRNGIPRYVSGDLAEYIEQTSMARSARRVDHNRNSFAYRQKIDIEGVDFDVLGMLDRAKSGHASPAELLHVHNVFGIPTLELASLTHPYGKRIELLTPMRAAVRQAITMHDGLLEEASLPYYEVLGSDNLRDTSKANSILMTREVPVGITGHDSDSIGSYETLIAERSSFIVRIDVASGFDQELATAIRSIPYENNNKTWSRQVAEAGQLFENVPSFLETNDFKRAVPVSTTIIAHSPKLEELFLNLEHVKQRQRQHLASAAIGRTVNDVMLTVGVPDEVVDAIDNSFNKKPRKS